MMAKSSFSACLRMCVVWTAVTPPSTIDEAKWKPAPLLVWGCTTSSVLPLPSWKLGNSSI